MDAKELRKQFSNELGIGSHGWSLITESAYQHWLEQRLIDIQAKSKEDKRMGVEYDLCECGHERKHHGKSKSINYTEGKCSKCQCDNFVIDNKSNFTKAKAIVRNSIYIKNKEEIKFLMAMKEVDE